jgi:hypothetical protein
VRTTRKPVTTSPLLLSVLLITAAFGATPGAVNAGALYKWVDEDGKTRYSDRLPATQAKKKHQQLSSQGLLLNTTEAARTEAELAAEAAEKLRLEEEQAKTDELNEVQSKKDQVLLLTFSTEEELEQLRNDRIAVLESMIQLNGKSLVTTQQEMELLQASSEQLYLAKGLEIPGGMAQQIEHFSRKIEARRTQMDLKMLEKEKIIEQHEIDLAHFRELKPETN